MNNFNWLSDGSEKLCNTAMKVWCTARSLGWKVTKELCTREVVQYQCTIWCTSLWGKRWLKNCSIRWHRAWAITYWYLNGRGKLISIIGAKVVFTSKTIFATGSAVENYGYYSVRQAPAQGRGLLVLCELILGFTIRVYHLFIFEWEGQYKFGDWCQNYRGHKWINICCQYRRKMN